MFHLFHDVGIGDAVALSCFHTQVDVPLFVEGVFHGPFEIEPVLLERVAGVERHIYRMVFAEAVFSVELEFVGDTLALAVAQEQWVEDG